VPNITEIATPNVTGWIRPCISMVLVSDASDVSNGSDVDDVRGTGDNGDVSNISDIFSTSALFC